MSENRRRDKIAQEDPSLTRDDALVEDPDIIVKENFTDQDPRIRYNL
jgi:hypothetical protein